MEIYTLEGELIEIKPPPATRKLEGILSHYSYGYYAWLGSKACFLTHEQKIVIELYRHTATHETAARELGLSVSQVKYRYIEARNKLCFGIRSYRLWVGDTILRDADIMTNKSGYEIFLHSPIDCLPISAQLANKLLDNDLVTISHLLKYPASRLFGMRGFGSVMFQELQRLLEAKGCLHLLVNDLL